MKCGKRDFQTLDHETPRTKKLDDNGQVLNAKYAEKRATDYLRSYCDPGYEVTPPFEDWGVE